VYQNSSDASYGGAMLLSGPRSSGSLGDELALTSGKIARSAGGDHLNDSIITEYAATTIGIAGGLIVTGSILSTVTPLISGSGQVISLLPSGTVSGSSQVLLGSGIWSGSAQLPAGTVSGSSQITFSGISGIPSGLVSGSSQIDLTATTNYSSGIKTRLNTEGVVSGSSQITLSSTTGFGTYINQALLTTSTPTFSTVSATTFTGALSGNASTATNSTQWNGAIFNGQTTRFSGDVNTLGLSGTSGVYNLGGTLTNSPSTYGTLYAFWNSDISTQFYTSYNGDAYWRKSSGTSYSGTSWRTFLDSSNYNSYSPTLTGTGASGNWGINITGTASNITAYSINQNLATSSSPTFADIYNNGWFRNNDTNEGLYNQANSNHWYCENNASWTVGSTSSTYGEIRLRYGHQGTYKGSFYWDSSGIGLLNEQGGWGVRLNYGSGYGGTLYGSWTITGTLTETSSTRYKTNIKTIESGLDKVLQMRGVVYNRKDNGKEEIGVIAEEMNEILPQVIQYNTESEIDSVSYSRIVGVLIEAIKDLKQEINELKNNG
jgi:hypothetical protein